MPSWSKNNNKLQNPCDKYVEYSGEEGVFSYWDKDKEQRVEIKLQDFILLDDTRFCISGYSEQYQTGIWSNEVANNEAKLTVKVWDKRKTLIAEGNYHEVKDKAKSIGGKFTKCLYIVMDGELIHVKLKGCAFGGAEHYEDKGNSKGGWINFDAKHFQKKKISVVDTVKGQKNAKSSVFLAPVFSFTDELTDEDKETAQHYIEKLEEFWNEYDENPTATHTEDQTEKVDTSDWQNVEHDGVKLGKATFDELVELESALRLDNDFGALYDNVCAGIKAHQDKQKKTEQKEEANWKEITNPRGRKLGEMSLDELVTAKDWIEENDKFTELLDPIKKGILELTKGKVEEEENVPPSIF